MTIRQEPSQTQTLEARAPLLRGFRRRGRRRRRQDLGVGKPGDIVHAGNRSGLRRRSARANRLHVVLRDQGATQSALESGVPQRMMDGLAEQLIVLCHRYVESVAVKRQKTSQNISALPAS